MIRLKEPKKIAYSFVVADLFHYGHLNLIRAAKELADYHVCGVISDRAAETYREKTITNTKERTEIIRELKSVDRVVVQDSRDPTENLKKLHREFPKAVIILVHGIDWSEIPGEKYVKSIGGKVKQPPYYTRLSQSKISTDLLKVYSKYDPEFGLFSDYMSEGGIPYQSSHPKSGIISTKADTLKDLRAMLKKSEIEKLFSFTVSDWLVQKDSIVNHITKNFNGKLAVRSSALNEDTFMESKAGYFHSELNVNSGSRKNIEMAVRSVINSYIKKDSHNISNQILVQAQAKNVELGGVVFTRTFGGKPYYVINYEEGGSTDKVTGGEENKVVKIFRNANSGNVPKKFRKLLESVREIETVIPKIALDIEFAVKKNKGITIFQVRPLVIPENYGDETDSETEKEINNAVKKFEKINKDRGNLFGKRTFFCDMPDWNPAEIIGDSPNPLAFSLYRKIITEKAWADARESQGYNKINRTDLVVMLGPKPYIDVRKTFSSFLPANLSAKTKSKLMDFYLKKLEENPFLQDKVEFEILFTCFDFTFDSRSKELVKNGFSKKEIIEIQKSLRGITNDLVLGNTISIESDLGKTLGLEKFIKKNSKGKTSAEKLKNAKVILEGIIDDGTIPFSRLARLAFVGKILLKSMVSRDIISEKDYSGFLASISTVSTLMKRDFSLLAKGRMSRGDFLKNYGHLRAGTYDITVKPYSLVPDLLESGSKIKPEQAGKGNFSVPKKTAARITKELHKEGLEFDAYHLFHFIKAALESRELAKFEFTKGLSRAIELIAEAGMQRDLSREDLSLLELKTIFEKLPNEKIQILGQIIEERRKEQEAKSKMALPSVLFSKTDIEAVSEPVLKPNFITSAKVFGSAVNLSISGAKGKVVDVRNKIVLIENADPGFDWVFTKNPKGMITKYGGVASHMSIRCAEFRLPAAIGCGPLIFDSIKDAKEIVLDCKNKQILKK